MSGCRKFPGELLRGSITPEGEKDAELATADNVTHVEAIRELTDELRADGRHAYKAT